MNLNLRGSYIGFSIFSLFAAPTSFAQTSNVFERDLSTIKQQGGCYIVDYSFTEVESLKEGYQLDERVYDTNSDKTTFEWIVPIQKSPTEIRLQHILFLKDFETGEVKGVMKHHAEDWSYEQNFLFDFSSTRLWNPLTLEKNSRMWTRKVTNLDDGLRYQCAAKWDHSKFNPEWNCANFSPIPGRESRDMGRKDYQALDRNTRIIAYGNSWAERQNNVKTTLQSFTRFPLARELGRTWYIKQPDSACMEAQKFVEERKAFWRILMNVWEEFLTQEKSFEELAQFRGQSRYPMIAQLEEDNYSKIIDDPTNAEWVKTEIRNIIQNFRKE